MEDDVMARLREIAEKREHYDGYYLTPWQFGDGMCMVLESNWRPEYADVIRSRRISALSFSQTSQYGDSDISFLYEVPNLLGLGICSALVKDLKPIECLSNLEYIALDTNSSTRLDFSSFPRLRICSLHWWKGAESVLQRDSLQCLVIENYPYEDLRPLEALTNLTELQISSRKLLSLEGIQKLNKIKTLDLNYCTQLRSLEHVDTLQELEIFKVYCCKKLEKIDPVAKVKSLKAFHLDNCGKIETLTPIRECKKLERVFFIESTNIVDGDISVLKELPNVVKFSCANRRHYKPNREEMHEFLKERRDALFPPK